MDKNQNSMLSTIIQSPSTHCSATPLNIAAAYCLHQHDLRPVVCDHNEHQFRTYYHEDDTITHLFKSFDDWDIILSRGNAHKSCNKFNTSRALSMEAILIRGGETDYKIDVTNRNELETTENKSTKQIHLSPTTKINPLSQPQNKERLPWISPKRIWFAARNVLDRTTGILRFHRSNTIETQTSEGDKDGEFAELDSILEKTSCEEHKNDEEQDKGSRETWLDSEPSPPEGASLRKGWNQRSLRSWINGIEHKFLSNETAEALRTIRKILEKFPDYGVVDLLALYSPKDVILSIVALSRLQNIVSDQQIGKNNTGCGSGLVDELTLNDLAHYAKFAHAAYGWKGLAAFCGRLHLGGDSRALVKRCGIRRRDILMASWHSRANRPAFFLVKDVDRKTLVLSIRGTMSPRDILTDLCASCENFFVEDKSEFVDIGDIESDKDPPSLTFDTESTTSPIMVGRAHKGMVDAAKAVARMTGKTISDELRSLDNYSLVIVGHSLGAGVAATLTTMWRRRFEGKVRCIGYGMPCAFPFSDEQDQILSVIGEGDPFSVISLGHLADTTKALSKLCQDKGFRDEILTRTARNELSESDITFSINAMECLRKQMKSEKLYPPGIIYLMAGSLFKFHIEKLNGNQDGAEVIKKVDSLHFNELKLHARMFDLSYHIPARYEAILERIVSSKQ